MPNSSSPRPSSLPSLAHTTTLVVVHAATARVSYRHPCAQKQQQKQTISNSFPAQPDWPVAIGCAATVYFAPFVCCGLRRRWICGLG
ncbi:unnamed protein product, partial [Citrullus colocynthis]